MPNLYATLDQIRNIAPETMTTVVTQYDARFMNLLDSISRFVDNHCNRQFYPAVETRYFAGHGDEDAFIDDLITVTSISYSDDYGATFTALTASDYNLMSGENYNPRGSYSRVQLNRGGDLAVWPKGQKAVKIVGVWAVSSDRNYAWRDTGQTVQDDPLSAAATTLTVTDIDAASPWNTTPAISAGNILRIEDEYVEVVATNVTTNIATIVRGVNGTTAAEHDQNTAIDAWFVHPQVNEAVQAQVHHQYRRGMSGFADAEAMPDMNRLMHFKGLEPSTLDMLASLVRIIP